MEPIAKSPNRIEANLDIVVTFARSERRFPGLSNNVPISKSSCHLDKDLELEQSYSNWRS